eukprot:4795960-Pyramimonas_sp.AAC.1
MRAKGTYSDPCLRRSRRTARPLHYVRLLGAHPEDTGLRVRILRLHELALDGTEDAVLLVGRAAG